MNPPAPDPAISLVRPATPADIPALARLAVCSYAHGFARILSAEQLASRTEAEFAARFAEAWPQMSVLVQEGATIGFAKVSDGHIDMFFLDPAVTGQGLGRVLLAAVVAEGARSLECFAENRHARRFYEAAGWRLESAYDRAFLGRIMAFVRYIRP